NPLNYKNLLSFTTFWWLNGFFTKGNKHDLKEEDMFQLLPDDRSEKLSYDLECHWKSELQRFSATGKKPSLFRAVLKTYFWEWTFYLFLGFIEEVLRTTNPILLRWLLRYFEVNSDVTMASAYIYASGIFLILVILTFLHHVLFYYTQRLGWHLRAATCALMYQKTLRLSQKALAATTTGQIVNLGSTDVIRFDWLGLFLHYLILGPLQAVVVAYLLWTDLGVATLAGVGVICFVMFLQSFVGRQFGKIRAGMAILSDERIRTMNEVLTAMRIIKMYAWEKPFEKLVSEVRRKEIEKVLQSSILKACNFAMMFVSSRLLNLVTFVTFIYLGGELTPSLVFSAVALYNVLRTSMGLFFPLAVEKLSESLISLKRIQNYLMLDEIEDHRHKLPPKSYQDCGVELNDFTACRFDYLTGYIKIGFGLYMKIAIIIGLNNVLVILPFIVDEASANMATLQDITLKVEPGQLLAVIGPVGSGKSSFLNAILRELPASSGTAKVVGQVTYAGQVPWVFSGSIRENILFGEAYDEKRYNEVVAVCCLDKDFLSFEYGDLTLVGQRGVTLSGGQKARVNLARAVYRRGTNIFLLDDPLSAVDASVAQKMFEQCICGYLDNKIRILVTHQLQFIQKADQVMILKEVMQLFCQSFTKCNFSVNHSQSATFLSIIHKVQLFCQSFKKFNFSVNHSQSAIFLSIIHKVQLFCQSIAKSNLSVNQSQNPTFLSINRKIQPFCQSIAKSNLSVNQSQNPTFLSIIHKIQPFFDYLQELLHPQRFLLRDSRHTCNGRPHDVFVVRLVDCCLVGLCTLLLYARSISQFYYCVQSGIRMHDKMFNAILKAPMRFFDVNPVGKILNRFSKDMGQVDELLPQTFMDFIYIFCMIFSILILSVTINYFVIIIVIPLSIYFIWLRQYYIRTSRDIKRMEGASRSPVFTHLSNTIQGLSTVRAFNMQDKFEEEFHCKQDLHSSAWFLFITGSRWLAFRLDAICAIFIGCVAYFSILTSSLNAVDAGKVGLTLTYAILLMGMFQWGTRQSAEVENLMTSVERIQQYYAIEPEAPHEIEGSSLPQGWPNYGVITFNNLSYAHYKDGPNILHGIRAHIKAHEKVGIVGRTGAGKSSLISTLFRLNEYSKGEILIDGIDVSSLGLTELRSAISIIPQDPILFAGTMRKNLDPFQLYSDEEVWNALEQVQLKPAVQQLPLKLASELAESGSNFSVGQRQLVCLARAVLRKNKILIIDEATANVDMRTDLLIQQTIRRNFRHCTVLTIAHRLHTIIDSDRVMVLDQGRVAEFDQPHILLDQENGLFSDMVAASGQ
uniref:ATP-binding cassette, sub-family C (CFTR/MRP), member 4 n=1 Tax=Ciona savignyi TaxID=51511 RepID=H2YL86_CIOSA